MKDFLHVRPVHVEPFSDSAFRHAETSWFSSSLLTSNPISTTYNKLNPYSIKKPVPVVFLFGTNPLEIGFRKCYCLEALVGYISCLMYNHHGTMVRGG